MDKKLLKFGRHLSGLTQAELGLLVGLDRSMITRYENGTSRMSARTHNGILEAFESHGMDYERMKGLESIIEARKQKGAD